MRLTADELTAEQHENALIACIEGAFLGDNPPTSIGIAVSGGGDSMALLHAAQRYCATKSIPVEAVTVNHGLRAAAADEAAMVGEYCAKLGVPHTTLNWDGALAAGNIAAAGRDARYRLIGVWAQERGVECVFLGHTQDDVAETLLMRLARKSGVDGLAQMRGRFHRAGVAWVRPLLAVSRQALRDYLRCFDVPWVDDPTNEDETYERTKARNALAELAPLGLTIDVLAAVAALQARDSETIAYAIRREAQHLVSQEHGDVLIQRRFGTDRDSGMEERLLIAAIQYLGGGAYRPRAGAVSDLIHGLTKSGKHTIGGCIVTQDEQCFRVTREYNAVKMCRAGVSEVWDRRWQIEGPQSEEMNIRALGGHIQECADWRAVGMPRDSLMASPAVFDGETLIAAPIAGLKNGFDARIVTDFSSFLLCR